MYFYNYIHTILDKTNYWVLLFKTKILSEYTLFDIQYCIALEYFIKDTQVNYITIIKKAASSQSGVSISVSYHFQLSSGIPLQLVYREMQWNLKIWKGGLKTLNHLKRYLLNCIRYFEYFEKHLQNFQTMKCVLF